MCISFFLENEINGNNNNDASSSSSGGFSIVPIAAAAGGGIVILIVVLIVVIRRRRQPTNPSRQRSVVAFENPTYSEPAFLQDVHKANPLYAWAEKDDRAEEKTDNTDYNTVVSALGHHAADGGMYDEAAPFQPAQARRSSSNLEYGAQADGWNDGAADAGYLDVVPNAQKENAAPEASFQAGDQYFEPDDGATQKNLAGEARQSQQDDAGDQYLEPEASSSYQATARNSEATIFEGSGKREEVSRGEAELIDTNNIAENDAENDATVGHATSESKPAENENDIGSDDIVGETANAAPAMGGLPAEKTDPTSGEDETIDPEQLKYDDADAADATTHQGSQDNSNNDD